MTQWLRSRGTRRAKKEINVADVQEDEEWEVIGMRAVKWNKEQTRHLRERVASVEPNKERPVRTEISSSHFTDGNRVPCGGTTYGQGFCIGWQNGPLLGLDGERIDANGAFVEDILVAAQGRIEHYQQTRFACTENALALEYIRLALDCLESRTKRRQAAGVEGSHQGS
jgi:hypothetical protein